MGTDVSAAAINISQTPPFRGGFVFEVGNTKIFFWKGLGEYAESPVKYYLETTAFTCAALTFLGLADHTFERERFQ